MKIRVITTCLAALFLHGCMIDIPDMEAETFPCNTNADCLTELGYVCAGDPGQCVPDSQQPSDPSDTTTPTDPTETSDPTDTSDASDPTAPAPSSVDNCTTNGFDCRDNRSCVEGLCANPDADTIEEACDQDLLSGFCLIDETCIADGEAHSDFQCKICDAGNASDAFTVREGSGCDDGSQCTEGDSCTAEGICQGLPLDCSENGTCDPADGNCSCAEGYSGPTCTECQPDFYLTEDGTCLTKKADGQACTSATQFRSILCWYVFSSRTIS